MAPKWFTLIAFFILSTSFARADEIFTTVFNVIESHRSETLLVLSGSDGRIYRAPKTEGNEKLFKSLIGKVVKLSYYNNGKEALIANIALARTNEVDQTVMDLNHFRYNELRQFAPTNLQSVEQATEIFKSMLNDGDKGRSQCFKRAHMWAFDMWSKLGLSTQKIFIFYTHRFKNLEEEEWWFHVAPLVVVNGQDYVFDGTFFKEPIPLKKWEHFFIKSENINCKVIQNYNDFSQDDWTKLCYLLKTPMYQFSPLDIENRDARGIKRNNWVLEELQDARRAFKNYSVEYEGLDTGKATTKY